MSAVLQDFSSDGYLVITIPEASMPPPERAEFVSVVKAEWLARQSRMTEADAQRLASEVDAGWWRKNRERILTAIGEA